MLLDSAYAVKSPLMRKIIAQAYKLPRAARRVTAGRGAYSMSPPIIVNSIPKSGTHLLLQVARGIPGASYYGSFIAWAPSWSLRKRSDAEIVNLIQNLAPAEVVGAHLHYSAATRIAIERLNGLHILIVRHPGAVLASEADYIANMSRFHKARRYYSSASSVREKLAICLNGCDSMKSGYPCFRERLLPYLGWLDDPSVMVVKFEDLMGVHGAKVVEDLVAQYALRAGAAIDVRSSAFKALKCIDPHKSHTYRTGKTDLWKEVVPPDLKRELYEQAGDIVHRLGYQ